MQVKVLGRDENIKDYERLPLVRTNNSPRMFLQSYLEVCHVWFRNEQMFAGFSNLFSFHRSFQDNYLSWNRWSNIDHCDRMGLSRNRNGIGGSSNFVPFQIISWIDWTHNPKHSFYIPRQKIFATIGRDRKKVLRKMEIKNFLILWFMIHHDIEIMKLN